MKHLHFLITMPLLFLVVACYQTDSKTAASAVNHSVAGLTNKPSAKITHEEGWTIISKTENGDRVYWFLAPEVDNVSPAMFKKTVFNKDKSKQGFETVSECDAPKQVCDELMQQFKTLSEKYK